MKKLILALFFPLIMTIAGCGPGNLIETKNTVDTREGFIITKGGKVWYSVHGADKKGIPLLVLHGIPGGSHDYLDTLQALSDERPVIFYDQLGCGNSDKVENSSLWTLRSYVDELTEVRKALNLNRVHILGHSWGTMIAVDYMLSEKKPKGVISLTLSSPLFSSKIFNEDQKNYLDTEFTQSARDIIANAEKTGDFKSKEYREIETIYNKLHLCRMNDWPESLKHTISTTNRAMYDHMWGPSEFAITGTLKKYERVERLQTIRVPALLTCGRFDKTPPATTAIYRNALPGAEISILEKASSAHHLEKAGEYNEILRGFLHRAEMMAGIKRETK